MKLRVIGLVLASAMGAPRLAAAAGPAESERPAVGATSHVVTESAQVLPKWTPSAGLTTFYGQAIGTAPSGGGVSIRRRTTSHALFAFGIAGRAEILADLPMVLYQQGVAARHGLQASALGDLRIGAKGTILPTPRRGFGLGVLADMTVPTGDRNAMTTTGAVSYSLRLLAEQTMGRGAVLAANLGWLGRAEQTYGPYRVGDAVTYATALRVPLDHRGTLSWVAEIAGEVGVTRGGSHPVVMRTGLRARLRSGVVLGLYGGGAPVTTLGVPDVHGIFAVHWASPKRLRSERAFDHAPTPRATAIATRYEERNGLAEQAARVPKDPADPDGDGMIAGDLCPSVAEDVDDFADDDGCPDLDNDHDGLRDAIDACPLAAELINGALDDDGCPDLVVDGEVIALSELDPARLVPRVVFAPKTARMDDDSRQALATFAELMRLNPWLGTLTMRLYVRPSGNSFADRRLAELRAHAVVAALKRGGVDPSRVQVRGPRTVDADATERTALAWLTDEPTIPEVELTPASDDARMLAGGEATDPTLKRLLDDADTRARDAAAMPEGDTSLAQGPPADPKPTSSPAPPSKPTRRRPSGPLAPPPPTFVRSPLTR